MTKSKRQLRAEAVERLEERPCAWASDYIAAMLGIDYSPSIDRNDLKDALIDILSDEPNDALQPENGVTADEVDANDWNVDSRENLGSEPGNGSEVGSEVENRYQLEAKVSMYIAKNLHGRKVMFDEGCELYDKIIGWLDIQSAITRYEQREWWAGVVDELTSERDGLKHQAFKLREQVDELTAENARLHADELHWHARAYQAEHERDLYRAKLGTAKDLANEIIRRAEL